jgi:hypothetical protein
MFVFQSRASTLSISEMKEFVQKNLKDIQTQSKAISMHIGAAEVIQVVFLDFLKAILYSGDSNGAMTMTVKALTVKTLTVQTLTVN